MLPGPLAVSGAHLRSHQDPPAPGERRDEGRQLLPGPLFYCPWTTLSCWHKALLSRRMPDTIEENLAGQKARLILPQALEHSHKCFMPYVGMVLSQNVVVSEWRCVGIALCWNGNILGYLLSCYVFYGDKRTDDHWGTHYLSAKCRVQSCTDGGTHYCSVQCRVQH